MGLKEVLAEEIDDDKFDALFEALFTKGEGEAKTEFFDEELDNAFIKYPLLARLSDRLEELALELQDHGASQEEINGFMQCRGVACIAIAAYIESEISDSI